MNEEMRARFEKIISLCMDFTRLAARCRAVAKESAPGEFAGADVTLLIPLPACLVNETLRHHMEECMDIADVVFYSTEAGFLQITFSVMDSRSK